MEATDPLAARIAARYGATVAPGVTVQQIPRGASSRPLPVWDGKHLVYPDLKGTCGAKWLRAGNRGGFGNPRAVAARQAREPRLRELHVEGLSAAEIAAALGVAAEIVRRDLHALGLPLHDPATRRKAARLADLRALVAQGHSDRDIADLMGVTTKWVRAMAKEAGVTLRLAQPERKPRSWCCGKTQARRQAILALLPPGGACLTRSELAARVGISVQILCEDLSAMGRLADVPGDLTAGRRKRQAQEEAAIRAAYEAGHRTPARAARAARLSYDAAFRAFKVLGLKSVATMTDSQAAVMQRRKAAVADRRARLVALWQAGCTKAADLAARLGASAKVVQIDLKALRAAGALPRPGAAHERQAA